MQTQSSMTSHLVSVTAAPAPGLLSRLTMVLARLEILPLQIYARKRSNSDEPEISDADRLEVDLYLSAECSERRDRLVGLLRTVVGVESVAISR
ncbi:MAG: hypothetical protein F8N37_21915 [Telmatospirillum sp.]|nr:hypothetical protein [Telmatospirillum sp.]